jgi:hypothetical protein
VQFLADKRNIEGYEEMHAVRFAGNEIILAENKDAEARYMVCDCSQDNPFGIDMYSNALGSADFVEIMKEFTRRLSERVASFEAERETRGVPLQTLTATDCESIIEARLIGRVIVIRPESLAPEYRSLCHK